MQTEIEAKFINVDHDKIRFKLKELGANLEQPMRLMKRVIMDFPDRHLQTDKGGWVRIRDEGNKITVTYKEMKEEEFGGAKEIEITTSSFERTRDIFLAIGLTVHSYQESKRETWTFDNTEIVLDEWPWIDPFIEIEGKSKDAVESVAKNLGFNWDTAVFGSVTTVYRKTYSGIPRDKHISALESICFADPLPDWFVR